MYGLEGTTSGLVVIPYSTGRGGVAVGRVAPVAPPAGCLFSSISRLEIAAGSRLWYGGLPARILSRFW
jgi:hypothetical protein